jgi:hypothetical protein
VLKNFVVTACLISLILSCKQKKFKSEPEGKGEFSQVSREASETVLDEKPPFVESALEEKDIVLDETLEASSEEDLIEATEQGTVGECEECSEEDKMLLELPQEDKKAAAVKKSLPTVVNLFVATNGSDSNNGSAQKPWQTLQHGITQLRNHRRAGIKKIVLNIRAGTYYLSQILRMTEADSPPAGVEIFIRNFNKEKVLISGGRKISGWSLHDSGKNIYKAKVEGLDFRKLYSTRTTFIRARTPNLTSEIDRGPHLIIKNVNEAEKVIEIDSKTISKWNGFEKVEMVYGRDWITNNLRLKNFTSANGIAKVEFQEPERNQFFARVIPKARNNDPYFFENAYGLMDAKNEWYFDNSTKDLYLIPNSPEDLNSVYAPVLETLLDIRGTDANMVSRIYFEGLVFAHTTWMKPSTQGLTGGQSIFSNLANHPSGAIQITHASKLRFEGCAVRDVGNQAFLMNGKTNKLLFQGNIIEKGSANGFVFYGGGSNGDIIADNRISRMGLDFGAGTGIVVHYGANTRIEHNDIWGIPYAGISVGWGWTKAKTTLYGNRVTNNKIHSACARMSDCGGIYTISRQDKSFLGENLIFDIKRSKYSNGAAVNGIFHDEGSSEFKHAGNIFERIEGDVIRKNKAGKIYMAKSKRTNEEIRRIAGPRKDRTRILDAMKYHN